MQHWTRREFIHRAGLVAGSAALYPTLGLASSTPSGVTDTSLAFQSAVDLAALLRAKQISSVELTRMYIGRIQEHHAALNAIVVPDFERALEAAGRADQLLAKDEVRGPLHGLPMTIKESYDIAGLPTTWGFPHAVDNIASSDAVVVSRFKTAGAHFMGKTNVPVALGDYQTYNDIYGTTNNPWDLSRSPGGSSGGSAAALAAGLTALDSGSDIGGSIRNPAHYCGVYGHKPTWGVVPSRGHMPPGARGVTEVDLAVVGPLARSAEDLALAMGVIAGADVLTSRGWQLQLPKPRMTSLEGLRVALWADDPVAPVDGVVSERVVALGEMLTRLGATVSDRARPQISAAECKETYLGLLMPIVGGPDGNVDHQTWMGLDDRRGDYRMRWQAFFADWDVLLCPISATPAFPHDHRPTDQRTIPVDGKARPYFEQSFWAGLATVAYLPSTVFPTGLSPSGLPLGLQAVGAEFDDYTTIEFARLVARELGGFRAPPGYGG